MNLRKKTMCIISFIFLCLIILLNIASKSFLGQSSLNLENQYISNNVIQATRALYDNINSLDTYISDWSSWDDTYELIETKSEVFIESNLGDSTFTQLNINTIIFINS